MIKYTTILLLACIVLGCSKTPDTATGTNTNASANPDPATAAPATKPGENAKKSPTSAEAKKRVDELVATKMGGGEKANEANSELISMGKDAVPTLVALVGGEDVKKAQYSLFVLSQIRTDEAFNAILKVANDKSSKHRPTALLRLGGSGRREPIEPLKAALLDESTDVKVAAINGLYFTNIDETSPLLVSAIDSNDWRVQQAAIVACGNRKIKEALSKVEAIAKDPKSPNATLAKGVLAKLKA